MRLDTFHQFALTVLPQAPDITAVEPWDREADHLCGLRITLSSGAQILLGITAVSAPGDRWEGPETPVTGTPPAHWPYPDLYDGNKTTPGRAQQYLAAAIANSGDPRIEKTYGYTTEGKGRGFGVVFHDGAKIFCLFHQTIRKQEET